MRTRYCVYKINSGIIVYSSFSKTKCCAVCDYINMNTQEQVDVLPVLVLKEALGC